MAGWLLYVVLAGLLYYFWSKVRGCSLDELLERGVDPEQLRRTGTLKVKGTRRVLRFALSNPRLWTGADKHGEYLELAFVAPSGCYATVAIEEILKNRCAIA